jgi:hypothetical protein
MADRGDTSREVATWFRQQPMQKKRQIAGVLQEEADDLANAIRSAARSRSGKLAGSVRVRRGRNTLELFVEAGGSATTKEVRTGSGEPYDYALAQEFGNSHQPAHPFFYNTHRATAEERHRRIQEKITAIITDE